MPAKGSSTAEERFWRKVLMVENCWEWIAGLDSWGYGVHYANGRLMGAHRYSYELRRGPIPAGMELDHLCRNKACVNPEHLEAVAHRDNVLRSNNACGVNARKTMCSRGHNDWRSGKARRTCRACERERVATNG